jgi:hypothetical protein
MRRHGWIPRSHQGIKECSVRLAANFGERRVRMSFGDKTPNGEWYDKETLPVIQTLTGCYAAWEDPATRTKLHIMELNEAEEAFLEHYVTLYEMLNASPLVKDTDLEAMGFPARSDAERAKAPVADKAPAYQLEFLGSDRVRVFFYDADSVRQSGKPAGQHGVEIGWILLDEERKIFHQDFTHSSFDTRSPYTFDLEDVSAGKYLFFSLRWENTRGEKGPWSPVNCVRVP